MNAVKTARTGCLAIVIAVLALITVGQICQTIMAPKTEKYYMMQSLVDNLNKELPRNIGTIGKFNHVSYWDDTLTYHASIREDADSKLTMDYYQKHKKEVGKLCSSMMVMMNAQSGEPGSRMAELLTDTHNVLTLEITLPSNQSLHWSWSGDDLQRAIAVNKKSSAELLMTAIKYQLDLYERKLPMTFGEDGQALSLSTNAILKNLGQYEALVDLSMSGKNIIFTFSTPETEATIAEMSGNSKDVTVVRLLLQELCEDPDFKEFINLFALAKCNMVFIYKGIKSKNTAKVIFPYTMLREYCNIPDELLDQE